MMGKRPNRPAASSAGFGRAAILMSSTSFLVPAAGILTAPLLARALDPAGRGELAAALAPAGLMLAAATLGIPEALTYYCAKNAHIGKRIMFHLAALTILLGVLFTGIVWVTLPFLSAGDPSLSTAILVCTMLTIPSLLVNIVRGVETGRQHWGAIAAERTISTLLRLVGLATLFALNSLTLQSAIAVGVLAPLLGIIAYVPTWRARHANYVEESTESIGLQKIVRFGSQVWLGAVASMLLAKVAQLLMTPLSTVDDLGFYVVASTISDVPLVVSVALAGAVYGVQSQKADANQLAQASRVSLMAGAIGCALLALTSTLFISPVFGSEFSGAIWPTIILLVSAFICVPGLMAGSALAAWGKPGLRSAGLGLALIVNTACLVITVPKLGVYGACASSLFTNLVLTTFMVLAASRTLTIRAADLIAPRMSDCRLLMAFVLSRVVPSVARKVRKLRRGGVARR